MMFPHKQSISRVVLMQLTEAARSVHPLSSSQAPRSFAPLARPWTGHRHRCPFLQYFVVLVLLFHYLDVGLMVFEMKLLMHSLSLRRTPRSFAPPVRPRADHLQVHRRLPGLALRLVIAILMVPSRTVRGDRLAALLESPPSSTSRPCTTS